jgi:hypothetical protein
LLVPFPLKHRHHQAATITFFEAFGAITMLVLLKTEALHLVVTELALNQNFATDGAVGIHVSATECLTAGVT